MSTFEVSNYVRVASGAMRGFVDVLMPSGMVLHRCTIFQKDGRAWVSPPSKPRTGRDGPVTGRNGKPLYEQMVSFVDRETGDRWSDMVVEAILLTCPDALE